jgi:hypothetical protein
VSNLRDAASWIWPGGMYGHRSLAVRTVATDSEPQDGAPDAPDHGAEVRSPRFLTSESSEKGRKTTRR